MFEKQGLTQEQTNEEWNIKVCNAALAIKLDEESKAMAAKLDRKGITTKLQESQAKVVQCEEQLAEKQKEREKLLQDYNDMVATPEYRTLSLTIVKERSEKRITQEQQDLTQEKTNEEWNIKVCNAALEIKLDKAAKAMAAQQDEETITKKLKESKAKVAQDTAAVLLKIRRS